MKILKIGTINLAVHNAEGAAQRFRRLGLVPSTDKMVVQNNPPALIRYHAVPIGDSSLSLVEPLSENSPVSRFLHRRGEGIYSISLDISDLKTLMARWSNEGVEWVLKEPMSFGAGEGRAHGGKCNWTVPKTTNGILFEIIEWDG